MAAAVELDIHYTTENDIVDRYTELMAMKAAKRRSRTATTA
ncbi:MAG: hypothetical protein QM754_18365 [Tepidisphaeraceae bacterium]